MIYYYLKEVSFHGITTDDLKLNRQPECRNYYNKLLICHGQAYRYNLYTVMGSADPYETPEQCTEGQKKWRGYHNTHYAHTNMATSIA